MTSYWPLLVALCLTGLGLGDSPLVIPSLCSLALSCVISILSFPSFFFFLFLSLCTFLFALCFFLHKIVSGVYIFITYKKKKKKNYIR